MENLSSPASGLIAIDPSLEQGATFRFPITWTYLLDTAKDTARRDTPRRVQSSPSSISTPGPLLAPQKTPRVIQGRSLEVMEAPAVIAPKPSPTIPPADTQRSGSEPKWEMVIPKMARPAPARTPRALQPAAPPSSTQGEPQASEAPTEISFYTGSEASFLPRRWKVLGIGAATVVVACVLAWVRPGAQAGAGSDAATAAPGSWSRRTAYLVGSKEPREILVYSGSEGLKNYRIEFSWIPEPRGVGWIYRATDSANYYAAKVRLVQAGAIPTLSLERFAVVQGVEGPHARKSVTINRANSGLMVRMDATGPAFTLYLQGSPADYWTDERFESGSLGFYQDRGERPVLQALRFTLFKKSGLQTVVTSLQ